MQVLGQFSDMAPSGWQTDDVALRGVVVVGTVIAKEPGFFTEPAHIYTPVAIEVDRVVHGDASVGQMHVAIEGGTAGCNTVDVDIAPALEAGGRYVFFLADIIAAEPALRNVWEA